MGEPEKSLSERLGDTAEAFGRFLIETVPQFAGNATRSIGSMLKSIFVNEDPDAEDTSYKAYQNYRKRNPRQIGD